IENKVLAELSITMLLQTTERKHPQDTIIKDPWFCHGTTGCALLYNKLYIQTGHTLFKDASQYWLRKTMEMGMNYLDGKIDYRYPTALHEAGTQQPLALLEGLSGVGLMLHSFIYEGGIDSRGW